MENWRHVMLIWANKNEIDIEMIESMDKENLKITNLKSILKGWELSVIFHQIKRHFGDRKDISILDFGAGASPFGAYLNHIGYQNVTCLDKKEGWHPEINQESYNKKYNANVRYLKTDITQGYDGKHDVIFSASVLEHIGDNGMKALQSLSRSLKSNGLFIHVVDYESSERVVNFKNLIDNCGLPIPYKPKMTPGCKEFAGSPKYAWWYIHKETRMITSVAFFNEK